jgi:acyl-CoA hydrolase
MRGICQAETGREGLVKTGGKEAPDPGARRLYDAGRRRSYLSTHKGVMLRMDYQKLYKEKLLSPLDAVGLIRDDDIVAGGMCGNEPATFLSHIKHLKDKVKNVKIFTALTLGRYEFMFDPSYKGIIEQVSGFYGANNRSAHELGLSTVIPGHLHNYARRYESSHHMRVFCCAATPMDRFGYFKLSLSCVVENVFLETADVVILEVNPNMPDIGGIPSSISPMAPM